LVVISSVTEDHVVIRLKEVTLTYGGDDVVEGVNLQIQRGETKVILGPRGVGKSTILSSSCFWAPPTMWNI
jgi:ABC-type transporter Mla maintaining outer membrane lipid asymmetry ATPase subunit MlaF